MAIVVKSDTARNEIRDFVVDNWRTNIDERKVLEEKWIRCLYASLSEFDKKWAEYAKQAGRSARFLGISSDAVDTLLPQIYDAVVGQEDWIEIRPEREGFSEEDELWAENMKYLLLHQHRNTKFNGTLKMAVKQLLILGNCPASATWYKRKAVDYGQADEEMAVWFEEIATFHIERKQVEKEYREISLAMKARGQEPPPPPRMQEPPRPPIKTDVAFEGPKINIFSIFNYVEEQHPNDRSEAVRIARSFRTKAYLQRMAEEDEDGYRLYENLANVKNTESEETAEDNEAETIFKMAIGLEMPHNKEKVQIKELHGTFEVNTGGEKGVYRNYVATVANDGTLIRCEPSPFYSGRPMIWNSRIGITDGAVYGTGPVQKGLDEQDSANAIHNQTIDATNCIIQPELEVLLDNLVDGIMKPSGPGAKHYVTEKGSITPIQKNFQGIPIGWESVNASIARHERITGATNTASGGEETATRTQRNSGIIATKLGGHVTDIEEEFVTEALNIELEMNAQYLETEQIITVTKDKRLQEIRIPPEAVRRGYIAHASGSKYLAEKQEKIQNLMMAFQMSTSSPDGRPMPVNLEELYTVMFKEILGEAGKIVMTKDEYAAKLEEWEQKQQAMLMMQQQGGQGGAGQGPDQQS